MTVDNRTGWRHWYHITLGTYGHWLPGDERGWHERHHRKHVPGSRLHPPAPSKFAEGLRKYSEKLLKHPPISFDPASFSVIGTHLLESLKIQRSPVLSVSVGLEHCHLLVQCQNDDPRDCAGKLKGHVYHRMFSGKPTPWEKRSHEEPIADYTHGKRVVNYILEHRDEGAWVWSFRDMSPDADA